MKVQNEFLVVKISDLQKSPRIQEEYFRETRTYEACLHPNICKYFGGVTFDNLACLALEQGSVDAWQVLKAQKDRVPLVDFPQFWLQGFFSFAFLFVCLFEIED